MIKKILFYFVLQSMHSCIQSSQPVTEYAHLTEEIILPTAIIKTYVSSKQPMATAQEYENIPTLDHNRSQFDLKIAREIFHLEGQLSKTVHKILLLLVSPSKLRVSKFTSIATAGNKVLQITSDKHGGDYPIKFREISHHVTFTTPNNTNRPIFSDEHSQQIRKYFAQSSRPGDVYNIGLYSEEQKEKMLQILLCLQSGTIKLNQENLFVATYPHEETDAV